MDKSSHIRRPALPPGKHGHHRQHPLIRLDPNRTGTPQLPPLINPQYSYRELSTRAFEHVHSLSLDFHISKKTGEVLSALSKGAAINTFLEQVLFQIFPVIVDLILASIYFCVYFDAYFALIVLAVMTLYIFATIKITDWRTGLRRDMVAKSREEFAIKNDSISNYETVKVAPLIDGC
jgi:ATP-binding cassette, subfamily B, vacuolar membrane transporter HMT1/ACLQ